MIDIESLNRDSFSSSYTYIAMNDIISFFLDILRAQISRGSEIIEIGRTNPPEKGRHNIAKR